MNDFTHRMKLNHLSFPSADATATAAFFERVYRLVSERFAWSCPFTLYLRTVLLNVSRDEMTRPSVRPERMSFVDALARTFHVVIESGTSYSSVVTPSTPVSRCGMKKAVSAKFDLTSVPACAGAALSPS